MNRMLPALLLLALVMALPAAAQNHGDAAVHGTATQVHPSSPYAGMETRRVKALSDEQIADLEAGHGMGLALAAELNGYPGPSHVLELAEAIGLTDEQEGRTASLHAQMKEETIRIGRRVLVDEAALDSMFAERKITVARLVEMANRVAAAQGELRAAHLRYHLEMAEILSSEQMSRYASLRGYAPKAD